MSRLLRSVALLSVGVLALPNGGGNGRPSSTGGSALVRSGASRVTFPPVAVAPVISLDGLALARRVRATRSATRAAPKSPPVALPAPVAARKLTQSRNAARGRRARSRPAAVPSRAPEPRQGGSVWDRLADCESSGDWSINTGNGYYGGIQFSLSSWRAVDGSGLPSNASRDEQITRGRRGCSPFKGWVAWPACSRRLGLR